MMKLHLFLLTLCIALPLAARAQDAPSQPIRLIVPASPTTAGDQVARLLAPKISERMHVPVIVDNKVGAGGSIGFDYVAKAKPDGTTYLMSHTAFSTLPALRSKLPYEPLKDFAHVVLIGTSPLVFVVNKDVPANNVRAFIEYAKKQPRGSLNYASPGVGSVFHLAMEMFKQETGVELTHVPYKSTATVANDIAAGHVQAAFMTLQTATSLIKSGHLKLLAVVAQQRATKYPETPTFVEAGLKNMTMEIWLGMAAPAGTSPALVATMNAEINQLLILPDVKAALDEMGITPVGGKPDVMDNLARREIKMWTQVVQKGGITE